jgi:hypothetical protein
VPLIVTTEETLAVGAPEEEVAIVAGHLEDPEIRHLPPDREVEILSAPVLGDAERIAVQERAIPPEPTPQVGAKLDPPAHRFEMLDQPVGLLTFSCSPARPRTRPGTAFET